MIYPNGRYLTASPYRFYGPGPGLEVYNRNLSDRLSRATGAFLRTASAPDGYGMATPFPPYLAGSISVAGQLGSVAGNGIDMRAAVAMIAPGSVATLNGSSGLSLQVSLSGAAIAAVLAGGSVNLLNGVVMTGAGAAAVTGSGALVLNLSMAGAALSVTITGDGVDLVTGSLLAGNLATSTAVGGSLSALTSLTGSASMLLDSASDLGLSVALAGSAAWTVTDAGSNLKILVGLAGGAGVALTGAADLRGSLAMDGGWTPFTELSPEGLAAAVWGAVAAQFNDPGTLGSKLNTASAGGVDMAALASAVLAAVEASTVVAKESSVRTAIALSAG